MENQSGQQEKPKRKRKTNSSLVNNISGYRVLPIYISGQIPLFLVLRFSGFFPLSASLSPWVGRCHCLPSGEILHSHVILSNQSLHWKVKASLLGW
ncbi:hypothetical protein HAX54_031731 [Datura stramonium]|uniref:Uncharacterized protein n=1 Tax=Datura stramonium TaxID=4076 RepID=A0ABS8SC44_DATST|nr:hypothetical protein [Datura stramonium]